MKQQAYQAHSLIESIIAFVQFLRMNDMNIGIQETQDALNALNLGLFSHRDTCKFTLKKIFCQSPEEGNLFEKLFSSFWDTNPIDNQNYKNHRKIQGAVQKQSNHSLVIAGFGKSDSKQEEAKQVTGANESERLKKMDLTHVSSIDSGLLDSIAKRLFKQMSDRIRRRTKETKHSGQINLRKTIRRSMCYGGMPMNIFKKAKTPKKKRLIVFLDVSGSMDKYSFFLLRFICALKENFRQLEAFMFSTSLKRITKNLQFQRLDYILSSISNIAENWGSGTKIGECFSHFNNHFAKLLLNGSPIVLILSDGLETGDANVLRTELMKIHRKSKRIIWLNPLKGMKNYQPKTKGMVAALPSIDTFMSAHNLDSLLELENILLNA